MERLGLLLAVTLLISLAPVALTVLGQPSEDQARQVFEEVGCVRCHSWDQVKNTIIEWAQNYENIDEAAQLEYGAGSYDDLMEEMRGYVRGITDDQYQLLYDYFLNLFQESRPQAPPAETTTTTQPPTGETTTPAPGECTPTTVTVTKTKTMTTTKTVTETVTKTQEYTVTRTEPPVAVPSTLNYAPLVAAILVLAALGYLALTAFKK